MLPRLALFKAARMNINHIVMVDGDMMKPLCIRMPIKHGNIIDPNNSSICEHCQNRGWTKSLGCIGAPVETDKHGRYVTRGTNLS